jgi:class 3 adenylate cyclase
VLYYTLTTTTATANTAMCTSHASCVYTHVQQQAQIGITTGTAYAGVIGTAARSEYAAVGDIVNMSARLMCRALPNTLLCDAATAKEAEDAFSFLDAAKIQVKGKAELVRALLLLVLHVVVIVC